MEKVGEIDIKEQVRDEDMYSIKEGRYKFQGNRKIGKDREKGQIDKKQSETGKDMQIKLKEEERER